jgi:hypothetical protein
MFSGLKVEAIMRNAFLFLMLGALAGCMTPAERAARAERDVTEMMQTYGPACEKLGYPRDSDQWRGCVLHLDSKAAAERPVTTNCFGPRGFVQCTTY